MKNPQGQPPKTASDLYARRPGMPRFAIEIPATLLCKVERIAKGNKRSRNAEIWALLEESTTAREKTVDV